MRLTAETTGTFDPDNALVEEFEIVNRRGLHARASAKFVQLVDGYDVHVRVEKDGMTVGGTSIMGSDDACRVSRVLHQGQRLRCTGARIDEGAGHAHCRQVRRRSLIDATLHCRIICTHKDFFISHCAAGSNLLVNVISGRPIR